ncbi:hypothetical protein [Gayadomonas joobiniege]|uniref:hypothetical protein n=1 Tax=Gayadomonas joobiniege TaxID=1234606 RepID=UPI0003782283|nr:hypothetical protein [Gayadomonas joobiniege]
MSFEYLQQARSLSLPTREQILIRSPEVQAFWHNNRTLLQNAWPQWQQSLADGVIKLDEDLIDQKMRHAVTQAWANPELEDNVKSLWHSVVPGVYQAHLFSPQKLATLRQFFEQAAASEIPLRAPYGIALNRHGAMLDPRSEGYLAAPEFQVFYRRLMDKYIRPIGRLLFPEITGFDSQTFGFSIQYEAGVDASLRMHTDASSVTLNVNLNLPDESFTGSEVDFYDPSTGRKKRVTFTPGLALIHRGNVAHAAQPITSGKRTNMVLWLYGQHGQIPMPSDRQQVLSAHQRWQVPAVEMDMSAPF